MQDTIVSSARSNTTHIFSTQEEADTAIFLLACDAAAIEFQWVAVHGSNKDIFMFLIYHKTTKEVWMNTGTKLKPKCIPVHTVRESLPTSVVRTLIAYHAITG